MTHWHSLKFRANYTIIPYILITHTHSFLYPYINLYKLVVERSPHSLNSMGSCAMHMHFNEFLISLSSSWAHFDVLAFNNKFKNTKNISIQLQRHSFNAHNKKPISKHSFEWKNAIFSTFRNQNTLKTPHRIICTWRSPHHTPILKNSNSLFTPSLH